MCTRFKEGLEPFGKVGGTMGVRLIVEPRKVVSREEFFSAYPSFSIGGDGYVSGAPGLSPCGLKLVINHHEDCDGLATRSSCAQAYHLLPMGLFCTFKYRGQPRADIYVNDSDWDVILMTYALMHSKQLENPRYKFRFKEIVYLEDVLDMSAGFYPIKKRWHLYKRLLWIGEAYAAARADKSLFTMEADAMHAMILQSHRRVRDTLYGRGKEIEPDVRFEILEDFDQWQVIREIGAHARVAVAQRGIKAFVSLVAPRRGKNGYRYILARRSKFIDGFPVGLMCDMLNKEEGLDPHSDTCWGGNRDNVIGSPRPKCGSTLPPERVIEIVKAACDEQARRRALDTPRP